MSNKHHRHENDCLNCGAELQGHFCHNCGQENMHVKEPFWHFIAHSISHYFHFDSKFFTTIKPLLTQPGQLTLDYLAGKRARYLHPVSMYIFVSIVYFIIIPSLHPKHEKDEVFNFKYNGKSIQDIPADSLEAARKQVNGLTIGEGQKQLVLMQIDSAERATKIKQVKGPNTNVKPDVAKTDTLDDDDDEVKPTTRSQYRKFASFSLKKQGHIIDSLNNIYQQKPTSQLKEEIATYKNITRNTVLGEIDGDEKPGKSKNKLNRWIHQFVHLFDVFNTPNFSKELEHYQPKLYFILMPLFAFFLSWSFRRNHRYYVEHLVFTIHFFTAFFIFEIIVKPIDYYIFGTSSIISMLTIIAVGWYCYRALRVFYERPRWKTVRKMITLSITYLIAFSISYSILVSFVYMIAENK